MWCDSDNLWLLLLDGRQLSIPLAFFPKLLNSYEKQLSEYELSGGGIGIHWNNLDEDLYVPNLLLGITDANRLTQIA